MAGALYDAYREDCLDSSILGWNGGTAPKVMLAENYTPNFAVHDFLNDVAPGAGVTIPTAQASAPAIGNRTVVAGVADGDDVTITAATGGVCEGVLIFFGSGTDSSSNLILHTDVGTGLPITPNGGDIVVSFQATDPKIFKL